MDIVPPDLLRDVLRDVVAGPLLGVVLEEIGEPVTSIPIGRQRRPLSPGLEAAQECVEVKATLAAHLVPDEVPQLGGVSADAIGPATKGAIGPVRGVLVPKREGGPDVPWER